MKTARKSDFTLIELLSATFVLSMLILGLLQIFSVTQKLMSSASTKIEMCSRAKLALDTIAADIECLYYKEDFAALCVKEHNEGSGSIFSLGTKRAVPVAKTDDPEASCGSNITAVNYLLHDDKLKSFAVGNDDSSGLCKVDESAAFSTKVNDPVDLNTFDSLESRSKNESSLEDSTTSVDVIEGVKDFNVVFMKWHVNEGVSPKLYELVDMSTSEQSAIYDEPAYYYDDPSNHGQMRVPDAIRIELTLYDQDVVVAKRQKDAGLANGYDEIKGSGAHEQKFIRIVSINRGQRNLASQKME